MSFRPCNLNICRALVAGVLCLAGFGSLRAGEPIEVVPFQGSAPVDTNFDGGLPSDTQNLPALFPQSAHSFSVPRGAARNAPPPQQPQNATPSRREKELMDLRRNWVFMTPEDFAKSGSEKDMSLDDEKAKDGKTTSAMERYYQHLVDLDQASATNQLGNMRPDRDSWTTNSSPWVDPGKGDSGFASSPFDTAPDSGIFQSKASAFASVFGSDNDSGLPSPEQVRAQAEQKAHMDSFKELWNMTPAPAAAPVSTPTPVAASSDSGFNTVQSSIRPALNALSPPLTSGSSSSIQPIQRSVSSMRSSSAPPHATFAPPQNPF